MSKAEASHSGRSTAEYHKIYCII